MTGARRLLPEMFCLPLHRLLLLAVPPAELCFHSAKLENRDLDRTCMGREMEGLQQMSMARSERL